jgi:hypothetical protein
MIFTWMIVGFKLYICHEDDWNSQHTAVCNIILLVLDKFSLYSQFINADNRSCHNNMPNAVHSHLFLPLACHIHLLQ